MVGMAKRKENRTASCAFHPRNLAQTIVEALLETPGIREVACIVPMYRASRALLCHVILAICLILRVSPRKRRREVIKSVPPSAQKPWTDSRSDLNKIIPGIRGMRAIKI